MLWAKIDSKIEEIQKLRDDGKKFHDDGNHSKSEELLNEALKLLNSYFNFRRLFLDAFKT